MNDLESLESVYFAALERAPADRPAFLDEACRDNPALREQVERLLVAKQQIGDFLEPPVTPRNGVPPAAHDAVTGKFGGRDEQIGAVLGGKYKLFEEIGEGGMGVVYMAQQTSPVKRTVAVKIIKAGMDSKGVLARFDAERQALAMMDHPNIARVLDAGTTENGRPYFVMELVKGVPITQYCDERRLTPRQRLELFVPVCHAIQHAHQKGVIHRDIKPSNVLVALYDDKPVPKVIDFGVAKAAGQSLTDKTLMTGFGAIVGTPEYMSPEQASLNNLDVDTRSDVYSLGVLLYELLTGATPLDRNSPGKGAVLEILRIVREVEAPRLSTKLNTSPTLPTIAAARGTEPAKLSKLMRGELDWILLKALDKDRSRRYESASGFAADIQRYLADEAIVARPPSTAYRVQKAWQRNKFAFAAGLAITASLVIGLAASIWQAVRAEREAQRFAAALNELRETAPAFAEQARVLVSAGQFDVALEKLAYAAKLRPDKAEYLVAQGDILQCQRRLIEAEKAYAAALVVSPHDQRAASNARLCSELLAAPVGKDGHLTRESLSKLYLAMQRQQRPAAELMPVAVLLGQEKTLLVNYWLELLKDLPVSGDRPLSQRLTMREDGLLALDLSHTQVVDLAQLEGAPLAVLNLSGASQLTSIEPLRGMKLVELDLSETRVADLSPLTRMVSVQRLRATDTPVANLGPLAGMPLRQLHVTHCQLSDLSALRGAPLEELSIRGTRVADLAPLVSMPLKAIDMANVPVTDFTALATLPLERCDLEGCQLTDLAVLRGLPLRELSLRNCSGARNYSVLNELKSLELLILPYSYYQLPENELAAIGALRTHAKLRQLGGESLYKIEYTATQSKDAFWHDWDQEQSHFARLRHSGFKFECVKFADGNFGLSILNQPFSDLHLLQHLPISELWLTGCKVTDLSAIRGLPLRVLGLHGNPVTDLSPLRQLPLEELSLNSTPVSDLTPLVGIPLKRLYLHDCDRLEDLTLVASIPTLTSATIPITAKNVEKLRQLPTLKFLDYAINGSAPFTPVSTTEQFWSEYDRTGWFRTLRESGIKPKMAHRLADGTWEVDLSQSSITDLSLLSGAPVSSLWLYQTDVSDLRPLHGLSLKLLHLYNTKVTDLSPLQGMPLTELNLVSTKVTDLTSLRMLPLTSLALNACPDLEDITPLVDIKSLKHLTLPPNARNIEILRPLTNLERLSYAEDPTTYQRPDKTAREFWIEYDAVNSKK